jgi:5-hydroxyisourate hydrolase
MDELMSAITTHVLDLTRGLPAGGVRVDLRQRQGERWSPMAHGATDTDGRVRDLLSSEQPPIGVYRLRFFTGDYFSSLGITALHPFIDVVFEVRGSQTHYHIPLLVTPHGYSTYRGS